MRGPGSVKVQGTAGITAELVAMASDILHDPESGLRRSALAHAVREIIRAEGDAPLLRAIEVAPDLHLARVIRAAAETACEVISVIDHGIERHAGLFSVPFVVRFTEAIATQEFEDALALASWSEPFLARLHDCGARHSISYILPHVFLFEDLANLSFGSVRHGSMMKGITRRAPCKASRAAFHLISGLSLRGKRNLATRPMSQQRQRRNDKIWQQLLTKI